jgi:hypothetical protein
MEAMNQKYQTKLCLDILVNNAHKFCINTNKVVCTSSSFKGCLYFKTIDVLVFYIKLNMKINIPLKEIHCCLTR